MLKRTRDSIRQPKVVLGNLEDTVVLEKRTRRGRIEFFRGIVAPVVSGVAGLSATAGADQRRAVTIATPEVPSREAVELHQLGRGREASHFRQGGGEGTAAATPVVSLDYFSLGLTDSATGQDTTPTLALCVVTPHLVSD